MPLLAGLIATLASGLAEFFVYFVTKKTALGLAAATVLAGITAALILALHGIASTVMSSVTSPYIQMGLGIALPPAATVCMLSIAACWSACTLYSWQKTALDMFLKA